MKDEGALRHRFALALLAFLALTIFVAPLATNEVFTFRDHFDYFQPLHFFTAEELRAARLPLWNPYSASGEPWLANPQTGVFYPPAWIFVVLPFARAYMLYLLFHLILIGWGAYLLFVRRASQSAALVGAAALMFSGPVLSLLDVSNNFTTFAWIPLVLWCGAEGAWKRGGAALALAFLAGEPFFAALAALAYVVVRRRRDVFGTASIAVGLSAVQLLPFLELVRDSDRASGMEAAAILRDSVPLREWLRVVLPVNVQPAQQFIPVVYVGVVVIALALLALTNRRAISPPSSEGGLIARHGVTLAWVVLLAICAFLASGPTLLAHLPLTLFRYPARLLPFAALALCGLAVAGWDRVRPNRRWVDLLVLLVVVADLLVQARPLLQTAPFRRHPVPYDASIGAREKIVRLGEIDVRSREAWISGYLNLYDLRFDAFTPAPLVRDRYLRYYGAVVKKPVHADFANGAMGFILTRSVLPPPFTPITRSGDVVVFASGFKTPMAAHLWREPLKMRPALWRFDTLSATVLVMAPEDGVLVLRQQDAPGWRVTIDGRPARSLLIDRVYRGVHLVKGGHEVVWTYRPMSLFLGAGMTLVTLASLQILVFVKRSRR